MASKGELEAGCRARDAVLKEIVSAGEQREKLLVGSLMYLRNPNEQCAMELAHWLFCLDFHFCLRIGVEDRRTQ
jgi:hypothetical protein